jgi:hypothetical protein
MQLNHEHLTEQNSMAFELAKPTLILAVVGICDCEKLPRQITNTVA